MIRRFSVSANTRNRKRALCCASDQKTRAKMDRLAADHQQNNPGSPNAQDSGKPIRMAKIWQV
jgi:hypothetical protein